MTPSGIVVRFLQRGEDDVWRACRATPGAGSGAAAAPFTTSADFRPDAHLLAERDGRVVGKLELLLSEPHEVVLDSPVVVPGECLLDVVGALLARGVEVARGLGVGRTWVILHTRLPYLEELLALMPRLGFVFRWKKSVHALDPEKLPALPPGPPADLAFRCITGPEDEEARLLVARVMSSPVNFNDRRGDNADLLRETVDECRANGTYRPGRWEVALEDGRPIGFVMPGWVDERARCAGNLYVGVVPEARGRGLGLVLHHRGLSTMKREQPKRFLSSTDADNAAMRRIFERLGYEDAGVQHYFEPT